MHVNDLTAELHDLYADASKHAIYQNIPDFVADELGYSERIDEGWRSDRPRLAYLLTQRTPRPGETWLDFGANTGFFALSLAHAFKHTSFVAVEANTNHARFMERVARYFQMGNVHVIQRAIGLREIATLPHSDFMLHLNVLHHAGHDFDADLVAARADFGVYAERYLAALRDVTGGMLFQMGSNWGGDKAEPLVGAHDDAEKLRLFAAWLQSAGWTPQAVAYPRKDPGGQIGYHNIDAEACRRLVQGNEAGPGTSAWPLLDTFPGEFYRRPLFGCS